MCPTCQADNSLGPLCDDQTKVEIAVLNKGKTGDLVCGLRSEFEGRLRCKVYVLLPPPDETGRCVLCKSLGPQL